MAIDFEILRSKLETLSPQMQAAVMGIIDAAGVAGNADAEAIPHADDWPNTNVAAAWVKVHVMAVHRGVEQGSIESNGRVGRDRRICPTSLFAWKTLRAFEPEPVEERAPLPATLTPREQNREALRARINNEYESSHDCHRSGGNR